LRNYQVLGAPGWTTQERFEIQATTGRRASIDEERVMVQQLLATRFGLKAHHESRDRPVYLLVIGNRPLKITPGTGRAEPNRRGINIEKGALSARDGSLDDFADVLTTNLDRPVLNKTNLTGRYDFTLNWDDPPSAQPPSPVWSPIGPALFTAVRELGLRLDAEKASVDVLVIDAVMRPSGN
jgi:uncharacterized protein (TIGR03435 family)